MRIIRPRFVALDSSHLAKLAQDSRSDVEVRRQSAEAFLEALEASGGIIVVTWHHFEELLRHADKALVEQRIAFFQALEMVGWVRPAMGGDTPGSIVDILALEVAEAFAQPRADAVVVRDRVAHTIFHCGPGRHAIAPYVAYLEHMQDEFRRRGEQNRETVAISRSNYVDIGSTKVADWLKGRWRTEEDAEQRLAQMAEALAADIGTRGDRRIPDAAMAAARFFDSVRATAGIAQTTQDPSPEKLLPEDIDLSEIGPDMTMNELGDLAAFRRRLRLVNECLGFSWPGLKARVNESRLPSGVIESALRRHRQDLPERKGSELIDQYLVCLAPYADVTYVDKRMHETVKRARRTSSEFAALVRRIEKAGSYSEIVPQLGT